MSVKGPISRPRQNAGPTKAQLNKLRNGIYQAQLKQKEETNTTKGKRPAVTSVATCNFVVLRRSNLPRQDKTRQL